MKKKLLSVLLVGALSVSLLAGCGGSGGAASSGGDAAAASGAAADTGASAAAQGGGETADASGSKTLKFGCFGYAETLDPGDQINAAWDNSRLNIGECLFKFNDDMTVDYLLADDYSTEDNKTWVFHIRDGLKFSNGNDVTASAVKASWENVYANTEGSSTPTKYMDYESITADDDKREVTVVLKEPQFDLRNNLAYPVFMILDTSEGFDWDTNPIGTGAYMLTAYEPKVSATLVKNPNYWNGEVPFDNLEVYYISDDTKTMSLQSGDVNLVENITNTADLDALKADDNYNVSIAQGVRCGFAYINWAGILKDDTLRQAVQMAIDDDTLCNVTVGGLYTPGMSVLPSGLAYGYDKLKDPFAYDAAGAAKLLDDAGYVDTDGDGIREMNGKKISLNYITYPSRRLSDFAEAVQATLTELGLEVNVNTTDSDTEWNLMVNGEYDLCDSNWTTVGNGDPTEYLANWYSKGDANYCNYKNDEFDKLYEDLKAEFDLTKRAEILQKMQQILIDDAAVLVHGYYNSSFESDKTITGANIHTADYYWITTEIKPAS
ncbi:MAG: ABC transporter substrate-binding protein [Lachnospiraceae bacterium]|nr:ABC transporter substrate-binding protein [Lachnospiraceae bacterium]